jgi:hypothetical protein
MGRKQGQKKELRSHLRAFTPMNEDHYRTTNVTEFGRIPGKLALSVCNLL